MKFWNFFGQPKFRDIQWRVFYCGLPPEKSETRLAPRVMPSALTSTKQQRTWQAQEQGRLAQVQNNLTVSSSVAALMQARATGSVPRTHFGNMLGLAHRGIGRLNSMRNVSCEPLV